MRIENNYGTLDSYEICGNELQVYQYFRRK